MLMVTAIVNDDQGKDRKRNGGEPHQNAARNQKDSHLIRSITGRTNA
jgi:hypothetical protein